MSNHPVVTKDYPENMLGGIMVCGINFGYSAEDERHDNIGLELKAEDRSFFSDKSVNKTRYRDRVLKWFNSWGLDLATTPGNEGPFERSLLQTNWLNTQTNSVTSNGKITVHSLVHGSDSFLDLLGERKPKVIVFVGSSLIEALNDIRIRSRVESIMDARSGNAIIHHGATTSGEGKKFKVHTQTFGSTHVVGLPHTQTLGLTDEYMASIGPIARSIMQR